MNRNNGYLMEDGPEDVNEYPLSIRFTYQRAILTAIAQAKITDGTYRPQKIICQLPTKVNGDGLLNGR
jgi:hypothetical protein